MNVRNQSFTIKKAAYKAISRKGLYLLLKNKPNKALDMFIRALSIYKGAYYSGETNLKQNKFLVIEDVSKDATESENIKRLVTYALSNISYCLLLLEDFEECRSICNEILKRNPNNIKAMFIGKKTETR